MRFLWLKYSGYLGRLVNNAKKSTIEKIFLKRSEKELRETVEVCENEVATVLLFEWDISPPAKLLGPGFIQQNLQSL